MNGIVSQAGMFGQAGETFSDVVNSDGPLATRNLTLTPETFDGATRYDLGTLADAQTITNANRFTLEGIVAVDSIIVDGTIVGEWGVNKSVLLWFDAGGSANFRGIFSDDGTSSNGSTEEISGDYTVSAGIEYHVAYTYDGANAKIYVNGIERDSVSVALSVRLADQAFSVGDDLSGSRYLEGTGRGFAIYDKALSAARILAHYNASGI